MAKYGINKVILVGNLGKDPEVRFLDQGVAVCNFRLATTERFRSREGNWEDRTEWHNIVLWRGLAETAGKYLKKGSSVYLEGRMINRSWDTKEGERKYISEVEASTMVMLDGRQDSSPIAPPAQPISPGNVVPKTDLTRNADDTEEDLPF